MAQSYIDKETHAEVMEFFEEMTQQKVVNKMNDSLMQAYEEGKDPTDIKREFFETEEDYLKAKLDALEASMK